MGSENVVPEPSDFLQRLLQLENHANRHASSLSEFVKMLDGVEKRVETLEERHQARQIVEARQEERDIQLERRLVGIEGGIEGIKNVGAKFFWVVTGAIVVAFTAFVIRGGLAP